jgi:DNA end-binding protein Ku
VKASQTIDILAFVPDGEIPYEHFETPYYVTPSGKGQKVYALLRETLRATKRIAVATVVIRTTQHLAAVTVQGKMLVMNTLRYPDELRDTKDYDLPAEGLKSAGVTPKEIELAKRLIDDMTEHWKPSEYHNTYHEDLMARIEQKIKEGETHEITKPEADEKEKRPTAKIIDLAELLKQSLGGKGKAAAKGSAKTASAEEGAESDETEAESEKPKTKRRKAASAAPPIRMTRKPKSATAGRAAKSKPVAKRKRA